MTSRQKRLVRGAGASAASTIIAAVSHTLGGGAAPHPLLVLALLVFLTPLAALLIGPRASLRRLSSAVLVAQSIFHVLFVALNATAAPSAIGTGHHHTLVLPAITGASPDIAPDTGMLAAHMIAAVLTVAWLWRGENLIRAVFHWVRAVLHRRAPRLLHARWPVPASVARTARVFVSAILAGDLTLRGPPAFSRV